MEGEVIIYKSDYIEVEISHTGGTTTLTVDNNQVRGDIKYKNGKHTSLFVSPNGGSSSMANNGGREVRFTLRIWENPEARYFWEQMKAFTQGRYSATVRFDYFPSIFTTFDTTYLPQYNASGTAEIENAVFEIADHFADQVARGEGQIHPNEVEIVIREGAGLSLIQLPMAVVSNGTQTPCGGSVNINASGSAKVDGSAITAASTGVLLEWRFGSYATAQIAPTDDPSAIANWTFVSGSWGSTLFEQRFVDQIDAGGSGYSFDISLMAFAYHSGSSTLAVGVTVVEGSDTSSEAVSALAVSDQTELFNITQVLPSAPHTLNLVLRWWNVCRALYAWGSGQSEEKDTVTSLVNNQHSLSSTGTKITYVKSSVDVREIVCPRQYLTSFNAVNASNVEVLALSEQFTPSSGGYYRETYSNSDDNDFSSLDVSSMGGLRQLYAVACDLPQNGLIFGTHNDLEIVSIDHQPVWNSALLTQLNLLTSIKKLRAGNDATSGAITNPSFTLPNLEELSAPFCNLGGIVAITNQDIKVLRLDDNVIGFDNTNYRKLEIFSALNTYCSPVVAHPLMREIGLPILISSITLTTAPNLEKVEIENNNTLGNIDMNGLDDIVYVRAKNCSSLERVQFDLASPNTLDHFEVNGCDFNYSGVAVNSFTRIPDMTDVNNCTIILIDNALTAAEVNQILVDLDGISSGGYTGRSIDITTNTAPDGTSGGYDGLTAKTSLQGKGFTVTTD